MLKTAGVLLVAGLLMQQAQEIKPIQFEAISDLQGVTRTLPAPEAKATVLVYVTVDCPIASRYAPEIRRIHDAYREKGVAFYLVYVDFTKSPVDVASHLEQYRLSMPAIFDVNHVLVKAAQVQVTPEVVVLDPKSFSVYQGRIDDTYVSHGRTRPQPTRYDLRQALDEVLAGEPVSLPRTKAVGCDVPIRP